MRAYTHGGTANQHNMFGSEKLSQIVSCAPDAAGVRTLGLNLDLEFDAIPTEPPRHPTQGLSDLPDLDADSLHVVGKQINKQMDKNKYNCERKFKSE